ncbi:MAG: hypothetical protein ACK52A_04840 [Planctomycetota bacterium]
MFEVYPWGTILWPVIHRQRQEITDSIRNYYFDNKNPSSDTSQVRDGFFVFIDQNLRPLQVPLRPFIGPDTQAHPRKRIPASKSLPATQAIATPTAFAEKGFVSQGEQALPVQSW